MRERLPGLTFVVSAFLAGRAALAAVVLVARAWVPERAPNEDRDFVAFPDHPFWDSFCRWDSGWYDRIARLGYVAAPHAGAQSDAAFFPAYPYLSRWLGVALGGHWAAGLVVSNLAFLGALGFLYALGRRYAGDAGARRVVWMALLYPATVFDAAYYAEGLFLLSAAGSFYFYEKGRLAPAGLLGGLAAMTRVSGVLLLPALLIGSLRRDGWRVQASSLRLLFLGLVPLGLGVVLLMQARALGDPLAFAKAQVAWGRSPVPFAGLAADVARLRSGDAMDALDALAAVGLFAVAAVAARRLDPAHAIFALGSVLLPLASGRVQSMDRYAASVPAVFLVLSLATARRRTFAWVALGFAALMALQTARFARWYWAG